MGTRITRGLSLVEAQGWTQGQRDTLLGILRTAWIPELEERKAARAAFGAGAGDSFFKVRKRLTGKQYGIIPGVYCDVVRWGDGRKVDSVVLCELEPLEKGIKKLIRTLEKASE